MLIKESLDPPNSLCFDVLQSAFVSNDGDAALAA